MPPWLPTVLLTATTIPGANPWVKTARAVPQPIFRRIDMATLPVTITSTDTAMV